MALLSAVGLVALGCPGAGPGSGGADGPDRTAWSRGLDAGQAPAVESRVWAAVPLADGTVRLGTYTVAAVDGKTVDLMDELGIRHPAVPTGLLREHASADLATGDAVLAALSGGVLTAARHIDAETVALVWNGDIVRVQAFSQEPLTQAVETFRRVAYADDAGWQSGLAFGTEGESLWLVTPDGRVEAVPAASTRRLGAGPDALAPEAQVIVASWAKGFVDATVVEVLEPGLAYRVREAGGEERVVGFGDLVTPPAPWSP
ncbi:MAG: hypothetical protein AAGM22_18600 [Acidobacteriota bacterium]